MSAHVGKADLVTALDAVSEAVAVWDTKGRLAAANTKLAWVFALPDGMVEVGLPFDRFLAATAAAGGLGRGESPTDVLRVVQAAVARHEPMTWDSETDDGRIVRSVVRPTTGGGWIGIYDDITGRARAQVRASHLMQCDALTNLPNRARFREVVSDALARDGSAAILFVNLVRFKSINDTLGYAAGDALLRTAARRLSTCLGVDGPVARLGSAEFAAALRWRGEDAVICAARRVIEVLSAPFAIADVEATVGACVGIARAPMDGRESEALMRAADMALNAAKAEGCGTVRLYARAMAETLQRRRVLEADLAGALARGEIELHYQPIVSLRTRRVSAVEALMRWRSPERGLVPPTEFIPVAEATRLIVPLGAWALRRACVEAAALPGHIRLAVNVSAAQFIANDLVADVHRALSDSTLDPRRLELEITESLLVRDAEHTRGVLAALRTQGVRIVMDDFGTGYASLAQLRDFPFEKIKMDRSFAADLGARRRGSAAMVGAVVDIAAALGAETVAEGVETRAQFAAVAAAGCHHAQGWLLGRPMPIGLAAAQVQAVEAGERLASSGVEWQRRAQ